MSCLVLDVSVAVKWFLPPEDEPLVPEALSLFRSHLSGALELIVPDLFWVEFASTARKAVRRRRWEPQEAKKAITKMSDYDLHTVPSKSLIDRAFDISSTYDRAIYDVIYVALAEDAGCDMITADERLVNALGSRFPVRWLGGMQF